MSTQTDTLGGGEIYGYALFDMGDDYLYPPDHIWTEDEIDEYDLNGWNSLHNRDQEQEYLHR